MIRRAALVLAAGSALALLALYLVGGMLSAPARGNVGAPPALLNAQSIRLESDAGDQVSGWFTPGQVGRGAVLLLHGVRGNRREMLGRALWLHGQGFAVMLIDLPAHGESGGEHITFGVRESAGVRAALTDLHARLPRERVGVIGVSLGAASTVLAEPRPALDAVVLESMYPTITEAVADRLGLHLGNWARPLAPLLLVQLPLRLGISAADLRPIDHLPSLHAPLLRIAGDQDQHTRLPEAQALFAAAAEPRQIWIIKGAAHVNLHDFEPAPYEARVGAFLRENLAGVTSGLPSR